MVKMCNKHGEVEHGVKEGKYSFCKKCSSEAVTRRRRKIKKDLVNDFGGKCTLCGYNKCIAALAFHHLDPNMKEFALSVKGLTRSFSKISEEAKKCILVCSNCHIEIHFPNNVIGT